MSTEDRARELMVKDRLTEDERHEKMVSRAVETEAIYEQEIEQTARELLTQERQNEANLQSNMLERTEEEIQ